MDLITVHITKEGSVDFATAQARAIDSKSIKLVTENADGFAVVQFFNSTKVGVQEITLSEDIADLIDLNSSVLTPVDILELDGSTFEKSALINKNDVVTARATTDGVILTYNMGYPNKPKEILIDGTLTELETAMPFVSDEEITIAVAVIGTINEFTAGSGVTIDGALIKDGGISANSMQAAFYPSAVQNNIAAGAGGAISVANYLTTINSDAGGDAFTLANGAQLGQMKKILFVIDGGGDAVITPATALAGGTTITMNDTGDYVILKWSGAAWTVQENSGAVIA